MPLQWVEPEEAYYSEAREFAVYHCYKNDNANDRLEYWFTVDSAEEEDGEFDIRDWKGYDAALSPVQNVQRAVENGAITLEAGLDKEAL